MGMSEYFDDVWIVQFLQDLDFSNRFEAQPFISAEARTILSGMWREGEATETHTPDAFVSF